MAEKTPFDKELLFLDELFFDREAFFEEMGRRLAAKGLVKDSFGKALSEREIVYPTGLATEPYPVALPHTDVEHVLRECISFVRFKYPVEFQHMGDPETLVRARFAFVMAIMEPQKQVKTLSNLIMMLSNQEAMTALNETDDLDKIFSILSEALKGAD